MKKRIISIWLTLSLVLSCFMVMPMTASAQTDMKPSDVAVEAGLLKKIGLLSATPEAIDGNKEISRADFAVLVGSIFGFETGTASKRYFEDVPMDHWAAVQINGLTEMNIISLPDKDKLFRPADKLTEAEAVKILICVLGYGDYANMSGGYPNGYAQVASLLDFTYTGSTKNITQYQAIIMLYDTLNSYLYKKSAAGAGYINYEESDETLLSKYFDIYATEGMVTQSEGVALYGNPKTGKTFEQTSKIVMLGEDEYTTEINLYDYLGRMVKVYYVQENEDDTPHIVFKEDYRKKDEILEISFEDYEGYASGVLSYYDEKGRIQKENIPGGAVIINNGSIENSNVLKAFSKYEDAAGKIEKKGTIRLVDTEDDNSWDFVFLNSSKNIFVASKNSSTYQVFDEINLGTSITLDDNKKIVRIEDAKGNIKTFDDIAKGQLLTVYESDDYVRVVINNPGISATVINTEKVDDELSLMLGKKEADAEWYAMDKNYYNTYINGKVTMNSGTAVTYYLDATGEIGYIDVTAAGDWQFGFMVKMSHYEDDDVTNMKLYMQDGKMQKYNVSKKVIVDGVVKKTYDEVYNSLHKINVQHKNEPNSPENIHKNPNENNTTSVMDPNEHEVFGQVIRVKINEDKEITHIDSEFYNEGKEDEMTLQRTSYRKLDGTKGFHWLWRAHNYALSRWNNGTVHDMGFNMFYNANTIRFRVPRYADMENATEKQYSLGSSTNLDLDEENGNRDVEGFKVGFDSGYEAVIVRYEGAGELKDSTPALVGSVGKAVRDDGEVVLQAEVYEITGAQSTIIAENDDSFKVFDNQGNFINEVEKGDIITYKKNSEGYVESVKIYNDYSVNKGKIPEDKQGWISGDAAQQDDQRTVCAYVKRYIDGIVYLRYPGAYSNQAFSADEMIGKEILKHDYAAPIMGGTAWTFDGKEVTKSTVAEKIESAEMLGFENSRPCYLNVNISRVNGGIFYEDAK